MHRFKSSQFHTFRIRKCQAIVSKNKEGVDPTATFNPSKNDDIKITKINHNILKISFCVWSILKILLDNGRVLRQEDKERKKGNTRVFFHPTAKQKKNCGIQ